MTSQEELLLRVLQGLNPASRLQPDFTEPPKTYNPTVTREGDRISIPDGAHLPDVIEALRRQHSSEEQVINLHIKIAVSPWDGAMALVKAIEQVLGVVIQQSGMFRGAQQFDVEVELGKSVQVPWGTFTLPGMGDASVTTDTDEEDGRVVFACKISCKRRYEARIRRLLDTVKEIAKRECLHRSKAFSIAFRDEKGKKLPMPMPKFFEILADEPVFRSDIALAVERNIFVPIQHAKALSAIGESLKRGILIAGHYGMGKTLLAGHVARFATAHGWTFIYVKDSEDLPEALRYSQQYQPVVVFAEDVDRVATAERTDEVNELLNQLDGIDSKTASIMTILTTNHPEAIQAAMFRPGRLDKILRVLPPDADAVERMIRKFADKTLSASADLADVAKLLAGSSPAQIREAINRAKLESLRRTGTTRAKITGDDLLLVAQEVIDEASLFRKPDPADSNHAMAVAEGFASAAAAIRQTRVVSLNGH